MDESVIVDVGDRLIMGIRCSGGDGDLQGQQFVMHWQLTDFSKASALYS